MTADESQADRASRLLREVRESDDVRSEVQELYAAGWSFTVKRARYLDGMTVFGRSRDPQSAWAYFPAADAVVAIETLAELAAA